MDNQNNNCHSELVSESIIIDGVDVAGREDKGTKALGQEGTKYCILENDGVGLCVCKHRPCEQLQRAKAEIEELKTLKDMYFTYYKAKHNDIKGEFFYIKKENERLKEENDSFMSGEYCANGCKKMNNTFQDLIQKNDQYRQVLQEIREIAGFHTSKDDSEDVQSDMQDIIAKINEVIGVE